MLWLLYAIGALAAIKLTYNRYPPEDTDEVDSYGAFLLGAGLFSWLTIGAYILEDLFENLKKK